MFEKRLAVKRFRKKSPLLCSTKVLTPTKKSLYNAPKKTKLCVRIEDVLRITVSKIMKHYDLFQKRLSNFPHQAAR